MRKLISWMLLVCLMCSACTVAGADVVLDEPLSLGSVMLQVPGDLLGYSSADDAFDGNYEGYSLTIRVVDWDHEFSGDVSLGTGDYARGSLTLLLYMLVTGDINTAIDMANATTEQALLNLPGYALTLGFDSGTVLSSYYYAPENKGILIIAAPKEGATGGQNLLDIALAVTDSFRMDGMTLEDMHAAVEVAAAEAAAAAEEAARIAAMQKYVVVTNDSAKVRTEPSVSASLIKTVYKGETFPMNGESGDFYIIEINGRTGYVHKNTCEIQ